MHARSFSLIAALNVVMVVGCRGDTPWDEPIRTGTTPADEVHTMPVRARAGVDPGAGGSIAPFAPAGSHLSFHGGKVIHNVHVVEVIYGAGAYLPEITSTAGVNMGTAYGQMVSSGVFDWLYEYDTSSPVQTIGRGSFVGSYAITPQAARNGATINDNDVRAELTARLDTGALPPATDDTVYMVHFPPGKSIVFDTPVFGTSFQSCAVSTPSVFGFCGYHLTFPRGSQQVRYAMLPDLRDGACPSYCGGAPSPFANQTVVAAHELLESITDPESNSGWTQLDERLQTTLEIADICDPQQGTFVGGDGATYTIARGFSNHDGDCITTRSVVAPDFSIAPSPLTTALVPGASATITVLVAATAGSSASVTLSVSGLPSGLTGTFSPPTVTAGSRSTLTLSAAAYALSGTTSFTITGTSGASARSATPSLTVVATPTPLLEFTNNGTVKHARFQFSAAGGGSDPYICQGTTLGGGTGQTFILEEYLDGALYSTTSAAGGPNNPVCTIDRSESSAGGWPGNWELKLKYVSGTSAPFQYTQISSASSVQYACNPNRGLRIYGAYSSDFVDNYYTYDLSMLNLAISYGYSPTGSPFSVELYGNSRTAIFERYYAFPPQTDHFMTSIASEKIFVTNFGYIDDGFVGNVYSTQVPGTVPMYRYSRYDGLTGDLAHYYSTTQAPPSPLAFGYYSYDGLMAYVCP